MYEDREWVTVAEAATRMGLTEDQIVDLARRAVIRSRNVYGYPEVEPCILV